MPRFRPTLVGTKLLGEHPSRDDEFVQANPHRQTTCDDSRPRELRGSAQTCRVRGRCATFRKKRESASYFGVASIDAAACPTPGVLLLFTTRAFFLQHFVPFPSLQQHARESQRGCEPRLLSPCFSSLSRTFPSGCWAAKRHSLTFSARLPSLLRRFFRRLTDEPRGGE